MAEILTELPPPRLLRSAEAMQAASDLLAYPHVLMIAALHNPEIVKTALAQHPELQRKVLAHFKRARARPRMPLLAHVAVRAWYELVKQDLIHAGKKHGCDEICKEVVARVPRIPTVGPITAGTVKGIIYPSRKRRSEK